MNKYKKQIEAVLSEHEHQEGSLLPVLHAVQGICGCIPVEVRSDIASSVNISRAELDGVISFYHDFRSDSVAGNVVKICRAEACQAQGARQLELHAKVALGLELGDSCHKRDITFEAVYCLGNCACGPSISINQQVHARVTPQKFDQLITSINFGGDRS